MMWVFIILFMLLAGLSGFIFIIRRLASFPVLLSLKGKKRYLFSTVFMTVCMLILYFAMGMFNTTMVFIHLLVFWLLSELFLSLICKIRKRKYNRVHAGLFGIAFTVVYMSFAVFFACHVFRTEYKVYTKHDTKTEDFRIVGFSDSHVGTTFHGEKFSDYVERMNAENADIIVIVGDFVDDDSDYLDMVKSCEELSKLKARLGVYFVYGNHDPGYYGGRRGYSKDELAEKLRERGITILEDDIVNVEGNIYLLGRQDSQVRNRLSMEEARKQLPADACLIVLDHEPNDQTAEREAEADLVLSGHTHGGQFFPINKVCEWTGINDMTYGIREVDGSHFIVSSGIADWAFIFKTGCISEYFVVDLKQ